MEKNLSHMQPPVCQRSSILLLWFSEFYCFTPRCDILFRNLLLHHSQGFPPVPSIRGDNTGRKMLIFVSKSWWDSITICLSGFLEHRRFGLASAACNSHTPGHVWAPQHIGEKVLDGRKWKDFFFSVCTTRPVLTVLFPCPACPQLTLFPT